MKLDWAAEISFSRPRGDYKTSHCGDGQAHSLSPDHSPTCSQHRWSLHLNLFQGAPCNPGNIRWAPGPRLWAMGMFPIQCHSPSEIKQSLRLSAEGSESRQGQNRPPLPLSLCSNITFLMSPILIIPLQPAVSPMCHTLLSSTNSSLSKASKMSTT